MGMLVFISLSLFEGIVAKCRIQYELHLEEYSVTAPWGIN